VRVTTFGDSNTDMAWSTDEPRVRARSYVSDGAPRPRADAPNAAGQLAGLVEGRWTRLSARPIRVVNHAISGTTTGGGGHGGRDRNDAGAPNARTVVGGVTRFEAEVLGLGFPWAGGEPPGAAFPAGGVRRVNAYTPGPDDFAYVSMGTNDLANDGMPVEATLRNLAWMAERWTAAGHRADHLVVTTLAPHQRTRALGPSIVAINAGVRALAARTGVGLVDLAAYTSADDGLTWRAARCTWATSCTTPRRCASGSRGSW
jgi:lysophospholipase L1-like esterase